MCSWFISSPFAILHFDLWMPSYHINSNGYMGLMNVMCAISQFVVVIPVPDESFATLAILFYAKYFVEIRYVSSCCLRRFYHF